MGMSSLFYIGRALIAIPKSRKGPIISDPRNVGPNMFDVPIMSLLGPSHKSGRCSLGSWGGKSTREKRMTTVTAVKNDAQGTSTEFGCDDLTLNAISYRKHKAIVDAASKFDNVDDAIAALKETWNLLQDQSDRGGEYTPPVKLNFGSSNAREIAEGIMGIRATVASTRKAFRDLGNVN